MLFRDLERRLSVRAGGIDFMSEMIPTSSIAVPIYEIICNMGLYDTRIALIIVYAAVNMPFVNVVQCFSF